ncbi:hypothetical protein [uncultured Albimonas sp.]|uniref:hypothetical protein n=1 Tax=uncultured Albimonas sp. TaxID=1331701 RepID=UPI0030ECCB5B
MILIGVAGAAAAAAAAALGQGRRPEPKPIRVPARGPLRRPEGPEGDRTPDRNTA